MDFHERTVGLALKSILNQTHKDWRLIVVDDGSTDKTRYIVQQFAEKDHRIDLIPHDRNRGVAVRFNEIVSLLNTDLLFRMAADDVMFPDRLERQILFMRENPDCDLLGAAIIIIDSNGQVKAIRESPLDVSCGAEIFRRQVLYDPTLCGRMNWFKSNPHDESLQVREDFELLARTAGKTKIKNLRNPLLFAE